MAPLQHVTDLHELLAIHLLEGEAAVAEELSRGLQYERPLAETMLLIGPAGAVDRLDGLLAAVRARVVAHGLRVAQDSGECVQILWRQLP